MPQKIHDVWAPWSPVQKLYNFTQNNCGGTRRVNGHVRASGHQRLQTKRAKHTHWRRSNWKVPNEIHHQQENHYRSSLFRFRTQSKSFNTCYLFCCCCGPQKRYWCMVHIFVLKWCINVKKNLMYPQIFCSLCRKKWILNKISRQVTVKKGIS